MCVCVCVNWVQSWGFQLSFFLIVSCLGVGYHTAACIISQTWCWLYFQLCNLVLVIVGIRWESQGYFRPNFDRGSVPFVISMPPPNVTGSLHMGHAMFVTLEVVKLLLNSCSVYYDFVKIHAVWLEILKMLIVYPSYTYTAFGVVNFVC